jgi:uncharacterized membrane protein
VQFLYYAILFFDILAAIALTKLYHSFSNKMFALVIVSIVVLFSLPTNKSVFETYLPNRAPARLSFAELKALTFLKSKPQGMVLTYPFAEKTKTQYEEPLPLYAYATTAYVSAFSGHPVYFEDQMNNEIIGQDIQERLVGQQEIFKNTNTEFDKEFLRKNNIKYIYLPRLLKTHIDEGTYGVKNIYHTEDVNIYELI